MRSTSKRYEEHELYMRYMRRRRVGIWRRMSMGSMEYEEYVECKV
jgi:hypothetical protein